MEVKLIKIFTIKSPGASIIIEHDGEIYDVYITSFNPERVAKEVVSMIHDVTFDDVVKLIESDEFIDKLSDELVRIIKGTIWERKRIPPW
jgi:hypothetical protein